MCITGPECEQFRAAVHKLCQRAAATVCEQSPGGPRAGQCVSSAIILTIHSHILPSLEANYENINTLWRLYHLDLIGTCFNLHLPIPMGPAIVILEIPYHKCGFSDAFFALEIMNTLGNKTSGVFLLGGIPCRADPVVSNNSGRL